jgi:hypothetical protein
MEGHDVSLLFSVVPYRKSSSEFVSYVSTNV